LVAVILPCYWLKSDDVILITVCCYLAWPQQMYPFSYRVFRIPEWGKIAEYCFAAERHITTGLFLFNVTDGQTDRQRYVAIVAHSTADARCKANAMKIRKIYNIYKSEALKVYKYACELLLVVMWCGWCSISVGGSMPKVQPATPVWAAAAPLPYRSQRPGRPTRCCHQPMPYSNRQWTRQSHPVYFYDRTARCFSPYYANYGYIR